MSGPKNPKFTKEEMEILVDEVIRVEPQLFGALVRQTSIAEKTRLWVRIVNRVNAVAPIRRTKDNCQNRWYDLRRMVKRKMDEDYANAHYTGGGGPRRPVQFQPWEEKVMALLPPVGVHGIEGVVEPGQREESTPNEGEDESQSQATQDPDPTDSDASHHSTDDPNPPGPSGSQTRTAVGSRSSAPTTAPTPATSQQTHRSPAHIPQLSQSANEGQGSPGTQEVADNTPTVNPQGSRRADVPTNAGPARVGRGGGSGSRRRREPDQQAVGPAMSELQDILEAYRRDTREFSQVVGTLTEIKNLQAQQYASQQQHQRRMEAGLAEQLTVHRDICNVLRRIADNMQQPPCVTRQDTSRPRPPPGTGREEEEESSDGASHASSRPAHEGPPRKVGRPRKRQ